MHGEIKTCMICGERIITTATQMGNFSSHILTEHKDHPTVKRIRELNEELRNLWKSLEKDRAYFNNKKELNELR